MSSMVRVAAFDDHPAVLLPSAFVETEEGLLRALAAQSVDVVIVDYDVATGGGLAVCQRCKERARPPRVIVYSTYVGTSLLLAARLARVDAVVSKSEPVETLLTAIRRLGAGQVGFPSSAAEERRAAMSRFADRDAAVAAMLFAGRSDAEIAGTLALPRNDVAVRARSIVAEIQPRAGERSR
jgi:two-component system response regulator DesR